MAVREHNRPVMHIEVPYGGVKLELERPPYLSRRDALDWLGAEATHEELPRILTSAVLLWHAEAGDIAACLDTAIVWERG